MNSKRNYSSLVMIVMTVIIMLTLSYIFWITWNDYYRNMVTDPFYEKGSLLLTVFYIILYIIFSKIYEAFKIGYLKVYEVIYSQVLSIIFTNLIIYMQLSLLAKRLVIPYSLIIMTVVEIVVVSLWVTITNKMYFFINPPYNMIMIYSNESAVSLMSKMKNHKDKYKISTIINISKGLQNIYNEIDKFESVVICDLNTSDRNEIVKYCFKKSIRIYMTPKISDIIIQSSNKLHIFDTPLILCKNQGLTYEQKLFKRIFDILISLFALILLSPIMIFIAALIKLYDGGPIIFKQKRLTIDNRVFDVYKFRSMIIDAELDGKARLASQNDSRITPVGKVIRKLRLDELPQLFNILIGDMSIVGPRPERPEIAEQYIKIMPEFEYRTKVKAGLTGYAQVNGKYNTAPYDKLKLDLMYIGNYSILMDIKLILMTVKILFMPESTEGIIDGESLPEMIAYDKD